METRTMRDGRSTEFEQLLCGLYPTACFRVRIKKDHMGNSIHVFTDLLNTEHYSTDLWSVENRLRNGQEVNNSEAQAYRAYEASFLKNIQIKRQLQADLAAYEHIVIHDSQGERLGGDNTFFHIHRLPSRKP